MMRYGTIVADPPWHYRTTKTGGSLTSGAAQKYLTLPTVDLCALPVRDLAAKNAIVFLWATAPMLPDALEVLAAWGFTYKGLIVWVKTTAIGSLSNGWARGSATAPSSSSSGSAERCRRSGASGRMWSWLPAAVTPRNRRPCGASSSARSTAAEN